jgi:hypothetical protein
MKIHWPSKTNKIININFKLMTVFDDKGNPILKQGSISNNKALQAVQNILEPLEPKSAAITSVTMGEVALHLSNGELVIIKPVYHPSLGRYKGLFKVEHFDFIMPDAFAEMLNNWRSK